MLKKSEGGLDWMLAHSPDMKNLIAGIKRLPKRADFGNAMTSVPNSLSALMRNVQSQPGTTKQNSLMKANMLRSTFNANGKGKEEFPNVNNMFLRNALTRLLEKKQSAAKTAEDITAHISNDPRFRNVKIPPVYSVSQSIPVPREIVHPHLMGLPNKGETPRPSISVPLSAHEKELENYLDDFRYGKKPLPPDTRPRMLLPAQNVPTSEYKALNAAARYRPQGQIHEPNLIGGIAGVRSSRPLWEWSVPSSDELASMRRRGDAEEDILSKINERNANTPTTSQITLREHNIPAMLEALYHELGHNNDPNLDKRYELPSRDAAHYHRVKALKSLSAESFAEMYGDRLYKALEGHNPKPGTYSAHPFMWPDIRDAFLIDGTLNRNKMVDDGAPVDHRFKSDVDVNAFNLHNQKMRAIENTTLPVGRGVHTALLHYLDEDDVKDEKGHPLTINVSPARYSDRPKEDATFVDSGNRIPNNREVYRMNKQIRTGIDNAKDWYDAQSRGLREGEQNAVFE
jgi:hypothetical protein